MTIMYCQGCHSVAECRVESPQPPHRTIYFERPYMNAYVRIRKCDGCGATFRTFELGEASFKALRRIVEMSQAAGEYIDDTWAATKEEFLSKRNEIEMSKEELQLQEDMEEQEPELGPNVISLLKYRRPINDDAPAD